MRTCVAAGRDDHRRVKTDQLQAPALLPTHSASPADRPPALSHAEKFLAGDRACQWRMRARARVYEYVNWPPPNGIYSGRHSGNSVMSVLILI